MAEYNYNDSNPHGEHIEMVNNGNLLWINIENPNSEDLKSLALRYPFHELNLKDCLYEAQLSKVDKYEDHVFVLLHFPIIERR